MPKGITYNPRPEGYGEGVVILKDITSRPFNYVEHNAHINMLIGNVLGNDGRGEGGYSPSDYF